MSEEPLAFLAEWLRLHPELTRPTWHGGPMPPSVKAQPWTAEDAAGEHREVPWSVAKEVIRLYLAGDPRHETYVRDALRRPAKQLALTE